MDIRKISVGPDYKGGAMHYIVGQKVLGDTNEIYLIKFDTQKSSFLVYIINQKNEVVLWKEFNSNIPISIESGLIYGFIPCRIASPENRILDSGR